MHGMNEGEVLTRIREICLALPETSERLSHGAPTFFVRGKRAFVMVLNNFHGHGGFARARHRGRPLRGRLGRGLHWDELAGITEDAYADVAPRKLVEAAQLDRG